MKGKAHSLVVAKHPLPKKIYADAAARIGDTGLTVDDNYIAAYQQDTGTYWLLDDFSGPTWSNLLTGSTEEFVKIITTGQDAIEYRDTLWDDLRIGSGLFQFLGSADPTASTWQPGGAGASFLVYKFQKNDEVFFPAQMPHKWKEGTDIHPHVHWTPTDRGGAESGALVGWKLDYSWFNINTAAASSATIDLSGSCAGVDDQHELSGGSTPISGTGKTLSSMLICRLYRSDTGADDTWAGVTAAQSPALLEFDFHFEIDRPGSRQEYIK